MNENTAQAIIGSVAILALLTLAILFVGEPDLMTTIIDYIKRH